MSRPRWHILRDGDALTLARHVPARFDFVVRTTLGPGNPLRLAHQIRQDLWRALQSMRGFSPVVELRPTEAGWDVRVGGRASGQVSAAHLRTARDVLENDRFRARWMRNAARGCRS